MVFGSFASTADESHLEGSVGNVSPVFCFRFRSVFGRFGLGFRWCLAFSHPLPTKSIFVFGPCFGTCLSSGLQLCHGGGYFFLSLEGSVSNVSPVFRFRFRAFLVVLGSDLGGVWPFRIHCRREPFLSLSLEGSVGNVSPVFCFRFRSVFGRFGLGFRWCLAFSHPLPTKSIFVFGPGLSLEDMSFQQRFASLSAAGFVAYWSFWACL